MQASHSFTDSPGGSSGNSFTDLLTAANGQARQLEEDGVLSLALPLTGGDPLLLLPHLEPSGGDGFRFLWDGAPGLCIAAAGRTNSLELSGPRRFELAQRFASASLSRLATTNAGPPLARPRVLLAFAFFDAPLRSEPGSVPGVQAVLPQLQIPPLPCWLAVHREIRGNRLVRRVYDFLAEAIPAALAGRTGG